MENKFLNGTLKIESEKQYESLMKWLDGELEKNIKPNTTEGAKIETALLLIKEYEDKRYPIPLPDVSY